MEISIQFENMILPGLGARWPGNQAIVVQAKDISSPQAGMWLFEREGVRWQKAAGPWPAVVGKKGVGKRAEGDGKSPSGAFLLGPAFGRAAAPGGLRYPYRKLDGSDRWVDDTTSPFYNSWVRGSSGVFGAGEELASVEQYERAVSVRYNCDAVRGQGSAIFLHVWRSNVEGTLGCTAVSPENMKALLQWLDYDKRPVLVQGTEEQIERLMRDEWNMLCLPLGWGFVDDFIPDVQLDIRYNTDKNFTGRRVPGYHASLAPMRMEAIEALANCAAELCEKGFGLRIFDAYRPQRATDAMIAWAEDVRDVKTKEEYYPDIEKADIPGNYVARRSGHRLGGTADLTLLRWDDGKNLDMGGPFDFFGSLSSCGYCGLTAAQAANRALLREAMMRHSFEPLESEWWHFTFPVGGTGGGFDVLPAEHALI